MGVSHRLRHLSLSLPSGEMKTFAVLGAKELPLLQSVNIFSPLSLLLRDTSEFWARSPLIQLPRLQHLSLLIQTDALTLALRWSHLTELCLGSGYLNNLDQNGTLKVLQRCPNLVRCCLHAKKAGTFVSGQSATLLYLEVLILAGLEQPDQLIRSLIIPHLHYLGIRGHVEASNSLHLVDLSAGEIGPRILDIRASGVAQDTVSELLLLLPRISHIRLSEYRWSGDGLLARLTAMADTVVCPRLSHLELECNFSYKALLAFLHDSFLACLSITH
ncbi:hypothetical protein C8R43DRAFT_568900 [Mycena crocata]|nr:hypothetical protein C8R43DRAFT_568900 [Mycena crocata]